MLKLDVFVRYDNDLAQILFDDFYQRWDGSHVLLLGDRSTEYCVIFENAQIANQPYFKRSRLQKLTKSELIDLLLTINNKDFYKNEYENKSYYDFDFEIISNFEKLELRKLSQKVPDLRNKYNLIIFNYPDYD